jgi:hypothetical protein
MEDDLSGFTLNQLDTAIRNSGAAAKKIFSILTSGTGLRFVIDLEKGKETCQIGKVLTVLHTLGIGIALTQPTVRMTTQ